MQVRSMADEDDISSDEIDAAFEKAGLEEWPMTEEAIKLRESVNRALAKQGYHLSVSFLEFSKDQMRFNFLEPMHKWAMELKDVDQLVIKMVKQARN